MMIAPVPFVWIFIAVVAVIAVVAHLTRSSSASHGGHKKHAGIFWVIPVVLLGLFFLRSRGFSMPLLHKLPMLGKGDFSLLGLIVIAGLAAWFLIQALSTAGGRKAFSVLLLIGCIVGLGLFSFLGVSRQQVIPACSPVAVPIGSSLSGPVWDAGVEKEFTAETYSSLDTAAYGLGTALHETIEESLDTEPAQIRILDNNTLTHDQWNRLRQGLKDQYPNADITFGSRWTDAFPEKSILLSVSKKTQNEDTVKIIREEHSGNFSQTYSESFLSGAVTGTLDATVETPDGKYFQTVAFDYRPWLWDMSKFESIAPQGKWLVVASEQTVTSGEEARTETMNKAAQILTDSLKQAPRPGFTTAAVRSADLEQYNFIVDEYSQKLRGLAGPIYRHALLLDVHPARIDVLAQQKTQIINVQRRSWLSLIGSFAGMILLICLVYAFLNSATKGYYARSLAVLSVLLAAGLGVIILMFMA